MKRFLYMLTISLLLSTVARAQYYSVNIDYKTVAAMTAAFATETASEAYYKQQVDKIQEYYTTAEVAAAGIFSSKYLDRKALTDVGLWASAEENYYYRRIYNMVAAKIMPKIWTVAELMLDSPHNALYWGSYLLKVCDETKSLCKQFESVVSNGRLSFKDVAFLELNPNVKALFNLSELGDIDWKSQLEHIADIPAHFSKENLKADIDNLYGMGVGLANAGADNLIGEITGGSSMDGILQGKSSDLFNMALNCYALYESLESDMEGTLLNLVGGKENVAQLFNLSNYNMTSWIDDYALEGKGQYYIQRWYIEDKATGEVVHEAVFDSYTMSLTTFKGQLDARLAELNDNEEGKTYNLSFGAKNYYLTADEQKLKGTETAIISVTCHEGVKLLEGNTQYKCSDCGGSLNSHSKQCTMKTTLDGDASIDTSELDKKAAEYSQEEQAVKSQIVALEAKRNELNGKVNNTAYSTEQRAAFRQELNAINDQIADLQRQLGEIHQKQDALAQAKAEATEGESVPTDDYKRIPGIMQDCKNAYNLTWQGDGHWNGYTYVRDATAPNLKGTIRFEAAISIARTPKYFLGIKIHRAIMQISWKLTADYSDTQVVDIVELDTSKSDAENAQTVNEHISQVAQSYPSCTISTEYIKNPPAEDDDSDDTYHLLWSSDRLEIARQIDMRLTKIYAELVSFEKMMHYKRSIIDVLKDIAPAINDEEGHRLTLVEQARKRWLKHAADTQHSTSYKGKYEDE